MDSFLMDWHLPTFPVRRQTSIIGVYGLNFCVRNGNRWNPVAISTSNGGNLTITKFLRVLGRPYGLISTSNGVNLSTCT